MNTAEILLRYSESSSLCSAHGRKGLWFCFFFFQVKQTIWQLTWGLLGKKQCKAWERIKLKCLPFGKVLQFYFLALRERW